MPCLIFRSTNELGCLLSQTSSRAAIIAGRGTVLGRQKGGSITSPNVPSVCVCGGVVLCSVWMCVSVCLSVCESVCLWPSTLHVSMPAGTLLSLSPPVCVRCLCRSSYIEGGVIQVLFDFFEPQEGP